MVKGCTGFVHRVQEIRDELGAYCVNDKIKMYRECGDNIKKECQPYVYSKLNSADFHHLCLRTSLHTENCNETSYSVVVGGCSILQTGGCGQCVGFFASGAD